MAKAAGQPSGVSGAGSVAKFGSRPRPPPIPFPRPDPPRRVMTELEMETVMLGGATP